MHLRLAVITTVLVGLVRHAGAGDELIDDPGFATVEADLADSLRPTEGGGKGGVSFERQSLDTAIVIDLVRERLAEAGLRAASELVTKLAGSAERTWARDLLREAAKLATAGGDLRSVGADGILRIASRAVIAELVVKARWDDLSQAVKAPDTAEARHHVADWLYWRISKLHYLGPETSIPSCDHAPAALCADLIAKYRAGTLVTLLDQVTYIDKIEAGIAMVTKLRERAKDRSIDIHALVSLVARSTVIAKVDVPATLTPGCATPGAPAGAAVTGSLPLAESLQIAARWACLGDDLALLVKKATMLATDLDALVGLVEQGRMGTLDAAALATALEKLSTDLGATVDGKSLPTFLRDLRLDPLADLIQGGTERVTRWVELARKAVASETGALEQLKGSLALIGNDLAALRLDPKRLDKLNVGPLLASLQEVGRVLGSVAAIDDLDAGKVGALVKALGAMSLNALAVVDRLDGIVSPHDLAVVRSMLSKADQIVHLLDAIRSVATGDAKRLGDLFAGLRALAAARGGKVSTRILDFFAPIVSELAADEAITPRKIYYAFLKLAPDDVMTALGLESDVGKACETSNGWRCWTARLVVATHGAMHVEDGAIHVDSGVIAERLVESASKERRRTENTGFLHLAVGFGSLIHDDEPQPLVAEQIGVGWNLAIEDAIAIRVAVYGSGLLYRFVLDSSESDGVMFGGALLVDIYDLVELHAGKALLIEPGAEMEDASVEWVTVIGAQVPLGDYLSRLAD